MNELSLKEKILSILESKAEFIFLLGSAGTERFTIKSDVDIAVFFKTELSLSETLQLSTALSDSIDREIDLISLNSVDPIFAHQVIKTGRLLFCESPGLLLNWKVEQLSKYEDLKTSRKIIEDNLLRRKKHV